MALVLLSIGAVFTAQTIHAYTGVCSPLHGIPGLMQRAGFFAAGTCVAKPGGAICAAGSACTISAQQSGTCKNTGKPGGTPICTCVANPVSQ